MDLLNEIMKRAEALPEERQLLLLACFDALEPPPPGEAGSALLSFSGILDDKSALEMNAAIEGACEGIDAREW